MIQKMRRLCFVSVSMATLIVMASCSNKETIESSPTIDLSGIQFTMQEEKFEPEKNLTRTTPEELQTVDLGDGLTAEVSLTEDVPDEEQQTRAPISDGKYFIFAINEDDYTESPHMTGTFKNGVFTRDAASPRLMLNPGTYTFVCGTVDGIPGPSAGSFFIYGETNTMVGVTKHKVVGSGTTNIAFVLKHETARLRFKVLAYTPEIQNATIKLTSESNQPFVNYYNVNLESSTNNAWGTIDTQPKKVAKTPLGKDAKFVQANMFMTEYEYLLPEVQGNDLKLNFIGGTTYGGANLAGKTLNLSVLTKTERNKSYTIQIKLKPIIYLFQDGTCGALAEKGSRTPIGIVVTEKTASGKGLAAALNFTPNVIWEQDDPPAGSGNSYQNNKVCYPDPNAGLADMNGYDWTWDKTSSLDGKVRGDEQTKYPAFYVAGHYNPGVTVTGANVGKWFLPSWGQLMEFFKLTAKDLTMPTAGPSPMNPWFGANPTFSDSRALEKLNNYIIQAGGNRFDQSFISTSTQVDGTPTVRRYQPAGCALNVGSGDDRIQVFAIWKTMNNGGVLPFVHF